MNAAPTFVASSTASASSTGQLWLLVVGALAMFAALFVGAALLFASGKNDTISFVRLRAALRRRPQNPARSLKSIAEQAGGLADRSLDWSGRRGGLEKALERAGVNMRAGEFLVLAVSATFAAFVVGGLIGGLVVAMIFGAFVGVGFRIALSVLAERRAAHFDGQLETTLPLMAGSLRAGFGIMQALDAVARESEAPTSDEFRRIVMESRLGRDLTDSLIATSARMQSEDFDFVVQAIDIHRQVGGDLAEVLDKVAGTIRDRNRVRRQVRSLSAEGRLSAGILFALPLVMFIVIQIINPSYLHELTGNSVGKILLGVGLGLMVLGGLWMRRLIRLVF